MRCPISHQQPAVSAAVDRCPFLHAVSEYQGEDVAARLALNPLAPSSNPHSQPIFPEDSTASLNAAFRLFHGSDGVIPLNPSQTQGCPFHNGATTTKANSPVFDVTASTEKLLPPPSIAALPTASISLAGFGLPDPGEFFRRNNNANRRRQNTNNKNKNKPRRQNNNPNNNNKPGASTTTGDPTSAPNSSPISNNTNNPSNNISKATSSSPSDAGRCPMRKFFGPLGGLLPLAAASGRLQCPPAIIAMRAAVAGLKPVRQLRPQALPIRSLAMGSTAILANIPCGMWREHTKKFSPEWFLAVHATIPFVAMLRKAVLMPPWAILLTVAGAVAGQQTGAVLERARLAAGDGRKLKLQHGKIAKRHVVAVGERAAGPRKVVCR